MAAKSDPEKFVTEPIPSQDDGSKTQYEQNVERAHREMRPTNPPAEQV